LPQTNENATLAENFSFRQLKNALTSFFLTELEGPRPLQEFIKKTKERFTKLKKERIRETAQPF